MDSYWLGISTRSVVGAWISVTGLDGWPKLFLAAGPLGVGALIYWYAWGRKVLVREYVRPALVMLFSYVICGVFWLGITFVRTGYLMYAEQRDGRIAAEVRVAELTAKPKPSREEIEAKRRERIRVGLADLIETGGQEMLKAAETDTKGAGMPTFYGWEKLVKDWLQKNTDKSYVTRFQNYRSVRLQEEAENMRRTYPGAGYPLTVMLRRRFLEKYECLEEFINDFK